MHFLKLFIWITTLLWLGFSAYHSAADPGELEKLRKLYKQHNLDFFGELISNQLDADDDEKRRAKVELLADDARARALEQLDRLLAGTTGPMRGELLVRKAALLSERSRTAGFFQNGTFKSSKLRPPKYYLDESNRNYQLVEAQFPAHPAMDRVLFSVGYNYGELRKFDQAHEYYDKMVRRFPASPLVGDARLAMAEIQFDKRNFGAALKQLKEIVKVDHPRLKNFALYKMAWTYYNMSDLDSGITSLEKVIEGVNSSSGTQRAKIELRKEALHDLVVFYSEKPESAAGAQALAYFETVAKTPETILAEAEAARARRLAIYQAKKQAIPDEDNEAFRVSEAHELLLRLTAVYRDQGKHEHAMTVAENLIGRLGRHPKTPALYRLRVESAEKLHKRHLVLAELERLKKVVQDDLRPVADHKSGLPSLSFPSIPDYFRGAFAQLIAGKDHDVELGKPEFPVVPAASAPTEAYERMLAQVAFDTFKSFSGFLHGEWTKTANAETAAAAIRVYDLAIEAFLSPWRGHSLDDCLDLRLRRAHLHYGVKNWDAAAADYAWLAAHRAEAASSARDDELKAEVASLEAWIKTSPIAIKAQAGKLHPVHQRLLAAYDRFLALHLAQPKSRALVSPILSASAFLLKEYGKTDEALSRMVFYASQFAGEKDGVGLTRDVLAVLEGSSRWTELRDFSRLLLTRGSYRETPAQKELSRSNEYASLRILEGLEKDRNWKRAAAEFAEFAATNPNSSFVSQALIKSANAALELKDTALAVKRLEEATKAPDSAIRLQAWLGLESFYRDSFQWKKLVELYSNVLKLNPGAKLAETIRKNLAAIRELETEAFMRERKSGLTPDTELDAFIQKRVAFEAQETAFNKLRFTKTNRNPDQNFKKKTTQHARLSALADDIAKKTADRFRPGAVLWANIAKARLFEELATTLETAALPAVLLTAAESDRKAYQEIITGQVKEIREKGQSFIEESAKRLTSLESPLAIEDELNRILPQDKLLVFTRLAFDGVWAARPGASLVEKRSNKNLDKQAESLGLEILLEPEAEEKAALKLKLARTYLDAGEYGFAYAVAAAVGAEKSLDDKAAAEAARIQFALDSLRLPESMLSAISDSSRGARMKPQLRWDFARWIASYGARIKDRFEDEEKAWFEESVRALLKPVRLEGPAAEKARPALSQR